MPTARNVQSPLQGVLLEFMRRKDLGQLEPPSSVLGPDDLGALDPGPPPLSSKSMPVPDRPAPRRTSLKGWWIAGAVAIASLAIILAVILRSPTPAEPAPVLAPVAKAPREEPKELPAAPPEPPIKSKVDPPEPPPKPREPARDLALALGQGATLEAVLLPAGRFRMGSSDDERGRDADEGPTREMAFPKPFYIGKFEVTQEQYEAVMGQNPSQFKGPRRPVDSVSSFEAQEFCERVSRRTGRDVRLPTEAEWEYACRAGGAGPFHGGSQLPSTAANIDGRVGYGSAGDGTYRGKTLDVGSFPPNAFGLYDMHGNVGEWCADFYDPRAYDAASPGAVGFSPSRTERVWRGGAYNDPPRRCRAANREHYNPGGRDGTRGFRVVIPTEPTPVPDPH